MVKRCPQMRSLRVSELYTNGEWVPVLHDVGWLVAAAFAFFASAIATWLMWMHAAYYHKPWEQRHIARILLMLPVYSIVALFSYVFYPWAMAYNTISSAYEAFALCSFFLLLRTYLDPDVRGLKHDLRLRVITYWAWPLSYDFVKRLLHLSPMNGLTWYHCMTFGISQYAILRPTLAVLSIVLEQYHLFCETTLSPAFGNFYIFVLQSMSVAVAMYCVVAFYLELKDEPALKRNKPMMKLACIKLVIFLIFWQSVVLQLLAVLGAIHDQNENWSARDVQTGLNALATCVEMAFFSVLHVSAFTYKDYIPSGRVTTTHRWRLFVDAFNFFDFVREFAKACRWLISERKIFDPDRFDVEMDDRLYHELEAQRLRKVQPFSQVAVERTNGVDAQSLSERPVQLNHPTHPDLVPTFSRSGAQAVLQTDIGVIDCNLRPPPKLRVLQTRSRSSSRSKADVPDSEHTTEVLRLNALGLHSHNSSTSLPRIQQYHIPKAHRVLGTCETRFEAADEKM